MINISKLYCGLAGESDELRYGSRDSSGPVVVYNCTSRCNLRCLHCYSASQFGGDNGELTTSEAKKLLSQLAEVNCAVVLFSGGEPLLRGDLFELLAEAKKLGLRSVLSTNGTLIDSAAAGRIAEAGVKYVGISIDGQEQFHDKFRNVKGCFKSAIAGIGNCKKAGIRTGLRFTVTASNFGQIPAVFDIAVSAGVRRICFYHLIRTGRAKNLEDQALTSEQTRQAVDTIIEKTDDFVKKALLDEVLTVDNHADGPYILIRMIKEKKQRCETAKQLLFASGGNKIGEKIVCVGWDGSVYPDQFWRNYSLGNIREKEFGQIWQNPDEPILNKLRNKREFADKKCKRCKWLDLCKGNFRFLDSKTDYKYWLNEPACYLADDEIL
jgi:radical SAM protein with 4Fe4S-binding SPASM domain